MEHAKKLMLVDPKMYRPSMPEKSLSRLDTELEHTLYGDLPDDEKVKIYVNILKKFRVHDDNRSIEKESNDALKSELKDSLPPSEQYKANRLWRHLKDNPEVRWSDRGELIYRQSLVPDSNITDLVSDAFKTKKTGDAPKGWKEFGNILETSNVPKELASGRQPAIKQSGLPISKRVSPKIVSPIAKRVKATGRVQKKRPWLHY